VIDRKIDFSIGVGFCVVQVKYEEEMSIIPSTGVEVAAGRSAAPKLRASRRFSMVNKPTKGFKVRNMDDVHDIVHEERIHLQKRTV
jgi:hypothetical protein